MTPLCRSSVEVNGEAIDCQRDAEHDGAHLNRNRDDGVILAIEWMEEKSSAG